MIENKLHRHLPTFHTDSRIYLPTLESIKSGKRSKRAKLGFSGSNNQVFLALTVYWKCKPVWSFGMWSGDDSIEGSDK